MSYLQEYTAVPPVTTSAPAEPTADAPDVFALLNQIEHLTREAQAQLAAYLDVVARGFARLEIAEQAVTDAVASAMAVLPEDDRVLFVDQLARIPGHIDNADPDLLPF